MISAIIVSYHTGPRLSDCLAAALMDEDIGEIILVDNGNPHDTRRDIIAPLLTASKIRILQGHGNIGFARACNYGANLAIGDKFYFLNPDAVTKTGTAKHLSEVLDTAKAPAIAGARLVDEQGIEQRGSRRYKLTLGRALSTFFGRSGINRHKEPLPNGPISVGAVSGAAMMMKRDSFDMLGGFDENYFLHVEEIDLCERANAAGGDVLFVPGSEVIHGKGTSKTSRGFLAGHKYKGFKRYFLTRAKTPWQKIKVYTVLPLMWLGFRLR